jgi:hypothetical protein
MIWNTDKAKEGKLTNTRAQISLCIYVYTKYEYIFNLYVYALVTFSVTVNNRKIDVLYVEIEKGDISR